MFDENTLAALEANYRATNQAKPKSQPKKQDNRKSWLSALPSLAAAGASFIPGVGTVGAAALGGLGELGRQAIAGKGFSVSDIGKEAALSAVPGGLGKLGKLAAKGLSGAKVAKTAVQAEKAANATQEVTQGAKDSSGLLSKVKSRLTVAPDETALSAAGGRIRGSARNITAGEKIPGTQDVLDQKTADRLNAITNQYNKGITSRTPRGQLRNVQDAKKTKGAELEELTNRFNNKIDTNAQSIIGKSVESERGKIVGFDPTKAEHAQLNNNFAARISGAKDIKELEQQRKYFDKEAKRILTNPDSKGTLSANLAKSYRDAIDDYVSKVNPALKTAKGEYRDLSMAEDFLSKSGTLKPQSNIGVGRVPTLPVKMAQEGAGKALQAVGSNKAGARFTRGLTGQVATRIAAEGSLNNQQEATPPTDTAALDQSSVDTSLAPDLSPETTGGSLSGLDPNITQKALQAAALQALAKGDTQGIAAIKSVMDIIGSGSKDKELTSSQATRAAAAKNALNDIPLIEDAIQSGKLGGAKVIPGSGTQIGRRLLGTENLDAALFNIADNILRARSGAAAPEAEVKRFVETFLPSATDSAVAKKNKLERAVRELQGYVNPYSGTEDTLDGLLAKK
jgi:hypothetical protein